MRIFSTEIDRSLGEVTLFLTTSEAGELRDSLAVLIETGSHHEHVSSQDAKKEITVSIYDKQPAESYDERARRLIEQDI